MNRLARAISLASRHFAPRPAVFAADACLTFARVEADSNRLASALIGALGLAQGDRVAILLPNRAEYVVADLALIKAGLVRVPINPRFAAPEVAYIVAHSGARALITDASFVDLLADIAPAGHVICIDAPVAPGGVGWTEVLDAGRAQTFAVNTGVDDLMSVTYTSGTTGRPKGAVTTIGARWASLLNVFANEVFVGADDVMLHAASLAHGTGIKVLPHYLKGAANAVVPRFEAAAFCEAVERWKATTTWMVPTMVAMLLDAAKTSPNDLSSLHTIMYAGAPMPEAVLARGLERFGPVFVQIYGLTEAPQPDLILPKEDHVVDPATGRQRRPGVTGRAAVGVDVRIVDEGGADVEAGTIGEIVIAGPHIMSRYWNDPEATIETLRDGWCYTGDLARADEGGYVYVVDRKKDMIISGGYNVYPKEVEDALYAHPAVRECAVVGAQDDFWGETVEAVIALHEGADADAEALRTHCTERLAGYKKPRRISFVADLPKTATGKIDKKALRR